MFHNRKNMIKSFDLIKVVVYLYQAIIIKFFYILVVDYNLSN